MTAEELEWWAPDPVDPDLHKKLKAVQDEVATINLTAAPASFERGATVEEVAADWKHGHGKLLLDSAISTEVARARGYSVVRFGQEVRGYGFSAEVAQLVSDASHALLVPLWDIGADSMSPTRHQLRLRKPRSPKQKYESLAGQSPVLDVNPLMRAAAKDGKTALWVTEGARKADALATLDVPCINLAGVDCWQRRDRPGDPSSRSRPLEAWDAVPLKERKVVVCYDSDAASNANVERALHALAGFLKRRGAAVHVARLEHAADGSKQGIDDYLGSGGDLNDVMVEPYRGDGRPWFRVDNHQLVLDTLRDTLGQGPLTGFYRRAGVLVHAPVIGENGFVPAPEGEDDGYAQVVPVTTAHLRDELDARYQVRKVVRRKSVPALVPADPAAMAVENAGRWLGVPRVDVVTHTPIMRADGTVLATPGYDAAARTLLLPPSDLFLRDVPEKPNDEAVAWAVKVISDLVQDFPFESDDARANYYALLLTPLMRLMVPPPYPFFILNAHQPGTGKTLLSQVARALHGGVHRPELPQSDEELRKQVSTILATTTGAVVVWDNASERIKSPVLAGLLTERTWNDRLLGVNRDISALNDRVWLTTGNNVILGGDMARRCYYVSLDAAMENPEKRPLDTFAQPDLVGYVTKHRGVILTALLVLARRWVDDGKPKRTVRSDSYAFWASAVAGMLDPFGLGDAFANQVQAPAVMSDDDEELAGLLRAIQGRFGLSHFQVKDVQAVLARPAFEDPAVVEFAAAMPTEIRKKLDFKRDIGKSLGWYLRNNEKRFAGGVRVVKVGKGYGGSVWQLEVA